jgi:hypothetical protein
MSVRIQNIRLTLFKLADPSITSYWVISWGLTLWFETKDHAELDELDGARLK